MRHAVLFSVFSGVAVAAPVLAAAGTAPARPAHEPPAALTGAAGASRVIEYRGLRVPVPAGWEVHRLDRDPSRCVRFDRHAVYLGRPGPQPDCPARVVGRTEALHIEPAGKRTEPAGDRRAARAVMDGTALASLTVTPSADHEARFTLPEAGVTITGVYGTDPARLQRILRGTRLSAGGAAAPPGTGLRPGRARRPPWTRPPGRGRPPPWSARGCAARGSTPAPPRPSPRWRRGGPRSRSPTSTSAARRAGAPSRTSAPRG
ncbi:hypothetical protein [Actinomadura madurae]|uniref:hypothetical protein n=1 Tax=Actinomadura madurae TaxID=1993 RepID=UPI0020D1F8E2|nr:hypothetical protein [Actinomadura madurae]MCQ0020105.1 hypothetical protein [Actinomadura madurae]